MSEYTNSTVGSKSCGYTTLGNYNGGGGCGGGASNCGGPSAPIPAAAATNGNLVLVPAFGGISYNTLTHNITDPRMKSCSGYFGVQSAYPNALNNCVQMEQRRCS